MRNIEATCQVCSSKFTKIRESHICCSVSCANKLKTFGEHTCSKCGDTFTANSGNQKRCQACIPRYKPRQKVSWKCEWCGKEEQRSKWYAENRRFCSKSCSDAYQKLPENNPNYRGGGIQVTCQICGKTFERPPYDAKRRQFCSRECQGEAYKTKYAGEDNPFHGKAHNAETKQKISKQNTGRLKGEKSPFFGKEFSRKHRENMSIAQAKRQAEGRGCSYIGEKGWYISTITGERNRYESSYEIARFQQLDALGAKWKKHHGIIIRYWWKSTSHRYTPDVLIEYPDGYKVIEEIKPSNMVDDERNQAKFKAAKRYCKKHGYKFCIITEFDLGLKKPKGAIV